jgi:hypothetical protein
VHLRKLAEVYFTLLLRQTRLTRVAQNELISDFVSILVALRIWTVVFS